HDPHGDPIPTREGEIAEITNDPLSGVEAGHSVVIQRVSDADPEMLAYLEEIGLLPGTELTVVEKAPFHGPIKVQLQDGERVVGHRIACNIFVESDSLVS
ncbi:MAG: FeoA family protein, partial [Rhodothermales bacterium]